MPKEKGRSKEQIKVDKSSQHTQPILITHNDLDAVGCAVLFKTVFPMSQDIIFCDYDSVDEITQSIIKHFQEAKTPKNIYIVDISVKPDTAKLLDDYHNNHAQVKLLDHHKTALNLKEYTEWATIELDICGARLLFNILKLTDPHISKHKHLIDTIEDYDLWRHDLPESLKLNRLLGLLGKNRLISRFLQQPFDGTFNELEEFLIELEGEKIQHYIGESMSYTDIYTIGNNQNMALVAAELYQSELGNALLSEDQVELAVLVNSRKGVVSLRSNGNIDVSELAKELGGGGHLKAAGFILNEDSIEKLFEMLLKEENH